MLSAAAVLLAGAVPSSWPSCTAISCDRAGKPAAGSSWIWPPRRWSTPRAWTIWSKLGARTATASPGWPPDGAVLYDTEADAECHGEPRRPQPEVREALATGSGQTSRYLRHPAGKDHATAPAGCRTARVLRISASRATVGLAAAGDAASPFSLIVGGGPDPVGPAWRAASPSRIIAPSERPGPGAPPGERLPMRSCPPCCGRIQRQRQQIDRQLQELRRQTDEFQQITANMQEGLVLSGRARAPCSSINPAACRIFQADDTCLGQDFLTVDRRASDVSCARWRTPWTAGHSELQVRAARAGSTSSIINPHLIRRSSVTGAVLLAFDVTERETAEQMPPGVHRQRLPRAEDPPPGHHRQRRADRKRHWCSRRTCPGFVGHIRREAQRLVALIGDIIRLSQLDEGGPPGPASRWTSRLVPGQCWPACEPMAAASARSP